MEDLLAELDALHDKFRLHNRVTPKRDWFRIENRTDAVTDVWIYDEIGWFGVTAQDFIEQLTAVTTPEITLHLNSPGGEVFDGIAIYSTIRNHPADVHVVVDSLAGSIASVIALAGNRISIAPVGTFMIHDAMGLAIGNSAEHRDMADLLDRVSDNIAGVYAARTGGGKDEWREKMRDETWFNAEEALAAGLVDEIQNHEATNTTTVPVGTADMKLAADLTPPVEFDIAAFTQPTPDPDPVTIGIDPDLFRAAIRKAFV